MKKIFFLSMVFFSGFVIRDFLPVVVHQLQADIGDINLGLLNRDKNFRKAIMQVVDEYCRGEKTLDRMIFDFENRQINLNHEDQIFLRNTRVKADNDT